MASRVGRKPKPTVLHDLHGTGHTTRHRNRAKEVEAEGELGAPPDFLTAGQKQAWTYAVAHAPKGLLKPIDRAALVIWVEAEDRLRRAMVLQSKLDRADPDSGMLVTRRTGDTGESPYLKIITRAGETLLRAMSELGFSPASRPRIVDPGKAAPPVNDPWQKLRVLQGGKGSSAA